MDERIALADELIADLREAYFGVRKCNFNFEPNKCHLLGVEIYFDPKLTWSSMSDQLAA